MKSIRAKLNGVAVDSVANIKTDHVTNGQTSGPYLGSSEGMWSLLRSPKDLNYIAMCEDIFTMPFRHLEEISRAFGNEQKPTKLSLTNESPNPDSEAAFVDVPIFLKGATMMDADDHRFRPLGALYVRLAQTRSSVYVVRRSIAPAVIDSRVNTDLSTKSSNKWSIPTRPALTTPIQSTWNHASTPDMPVQRNHRNSVTLDRTSEQESTSQQIPVLPPVPKLSLELRSRSLHFPSRRAQGPRNAPHDIESASRLITC
jgi:hypothetical protein